MKKYLFVLFLFFLSISNVFAEETKTGLGFLNNSTVIISNDRGSDITLSRNTANSVNMDIRTIIFQSSYNFQKNVVYEYEVELANQYINNINRISILAGNNICSFISLQGLNASYLKIRFSCPDNVSYVTIGLSNLGGSTITNSYNIRWNNIYLWSVTDTVDLGPIINNDNTNTNNIINNQNQNTQDIIDSNKVCTFIDKNSISKDNYYLNSSGGEVSYSLSGITDYINIQGATIKNLQTYNQGWALATCFYNINKEKISCTLNQNLTTTIPDGAAYLRATIQKDVNKPQFEICQNGNQSLNNSINNLDDTINDDNTSDAENKASEFFSSFNTETFGLTSIITAPLNLIRSVIGEGSVCTTLRLPLPYLDNKYLELPCMYSIYRDYFGDFFTIYQTITYGIVAYWVIVRIFNQVKDFKNPEHDEIEVMDL